MYFFKFGQTLMDKIVCDRESRNCMMHRCENCPGKEALSDFLHNYYKGRK